ncbi:MAG TPA: hypothetical protein VFM10_07830 [Terriglobales bacterium]|nr:hypothetical protein [Terriglobales bacterium]
MASSCIFNSVRHASRADSARLEFYYKYTSATAVFATHLQTEGVCLILTTPLAWPVVPQSLGAISPVMKARVSEVRTRDVPEDDVPGEYRNDDHAA